MDLKTVCRNSFIFIFTLLALNICIEVLEKQMIIACVVGGAITGVLITYINSRHASKTQQKQS